MDRNLRNAIICFVIAGILLYLFEGCAKRIEIEGVCRHEALFVAAILVEEHPDQTWIEWSKTGKFEYHVQAFVKDGSGNKKYFTRWNNYAVESDRDTQAGDFYKDQKVYEFFRSQYQWWR